MRFSSVARGASFPYSPGLRSLRSRARSRWYASSLADPNCNGAEAGELGVTAPATSLGQIGRDRCARTSELTGQAVEFFTLKVFGHPVNQQGQFVRLLPDFQFVEIFHASILTKLFGSA